MAFEHYLRSGQKLLRCGYTTGSCAALAARGATTLLLTGTAPGSASLQTSKGIVVEIIPEFCHWQAAGVATCGVVKDAGDDADSTDGALICASVHKTDIPGIAIDGGRGVGRVTQKGLEQPVGAAAINRVPRQMIEAEVAAVARAAGYDGGLQVVIEVPEGEALAAKTFNPQLGITGGISILGTSGIVEPMSEQALVDTIRLAVHQAAALGARHILLTPGNYGEAFLKEKGLDLQGIPVIKYANFLGEALDSVAEEGFESVLLVGHVGKLVKLAGGIMNTHSRYADCRTELFCAHAAICGASTATCRALMAAATTDACLELLAAVGLREQVLAGLLTSMQQHLARRVAGAYRVGAVLFSNASGFLGQTATVEEIIKQWK